MNFKTVAAHQRMVALAYPCEVADRCSDPRYFFSVTPQQGIACVVGLTVNIGEE